MKLREIEVLTGQGENVLGACRKAGILPGSPVERDARPRLHEVKPSGLGFKHDQKSPGCERGGG